jgi:cytochrome b subunit of formate dehydrogenase
MKRSHTYKAYPDWRQREMRMLIWALAVGGVAAAVTGVAIYFVSRGGPVN